MDLNSSSDSEGSEDDADQKPSPTLGAETRLRFSVETAGGKTMEPSLLEATSTFHAKRRVSSCVRDSHILQSQHAPVAAQEQSECLGYYYVRLRLAGRHIRRDAVLKVATYNEKKLRRPHCSKNQIPPRPADTNGEAHEDMDAVDETFAAVNADDRLDQRASEIQSEIPDTIVVNEQATEVWRAMKKAVAAGTP
eukprot:CAMPEP_0119316054 /NCGR_PEP_ID=MMETSP1333-20130426/38359_1 /TAXON_ID=418940 /ORGANISM="Scyphosphaera apsteinii, Strain RCC1455" /LENGTH=193 /DNA_ID=CAMNT_0007321593 /DNA_START=32 /DNA_END=610 /DNA_ORIENTATION=+